MTRAIPRKARPGGSSAVEIPSRLSALSSVANTDPLGAIDALEDLLTNTDTSELEAVITWLAGRSSQAAGWIESLPDGPLRNGIVERLLAMVSTRDPSAALRTAEALITPELRDAAVSSVARRWAADSPTEALSAIAARDDWRQSTVLGRAFLAALTEHPRQIAEWLALVPEGSIDQSFFGQAAELLLAKDPASLTLWWETIQEPECRSAIADAVLMHSGRNGPALAFAWATQLSDPVHRQETLQGLFRRAADRDASATTLLDSPWLSPEDRTALLHWVESGEKATALGRR